ncbi:hypothetical protein AGOR_G00142520 [Albula goreensis]|uniref:Myoneurin n=1 Tax=Albula goreensis TaxID=1534307 RepID=A0A8T3D6R2_9TELE|nr:hypothetical protein AGOR_G00142520 [Albula goreensis]
MQYLPHGERLLDQLKKQQESGCFCDCTIAIGASRFRAHRNVLAVFSEYFRSQCQNAGDDDVTISLDPEWMTEQVFQGLLNYVYTGNLHVDSDNAEDICKAATFLQMEDVVMLCILVREDIKPICIELSDTSDTQEKDREPGSVSPAPDTTNDIDMADDELEPERSDPEPVSEKAEQQQQVEQVEQEEEVTPKVRVSQRARKPKVMSDGSVLSSCTVLLRKEINRLVKQPKLSCDTPNTAANQELVAIPEDAEWCPPVSEDSQDKPEPPPKRKRGRPRKDRSIENRASKPPPPPKEAEENNSKEHLTFVKGKPLCSVCGKTFSESSSVRRHMRIHKGVKPYQCQLCSKSFRQGNQLKTHMRIHTGEKPFQCHTCDKSFAQKCQLVFHCRMQHGEDKPYKCDTCGLQFATSSNFKIHVRKHSTQGEKPYVCDTCGKAFAVSSSLLAHSRKHTGDMSSFCTVCHRNFGSVKELNSHFPCQKGEKRVGCDMCEKSYTGTKYLKKHKQKAHNVPSDDTGLLPFSQNIPIDHQALLSRTPPGPGTVELLTRAAAVAAEEAAAAAAKLAEAEAAAGAAAAALAAAEARAQARMAAETARAENGVVAAVAGGASVLTAAEADTAASELTAVEAAAVEADAAEAAAAAAAVAAIEDSGAVVLDASGADIDINTSTAIAAAADGTDQSQTRIIIFTLE